MSEAEKSTAPKLSKKQVKNWRLIREASLWAIIVIQLTFFAGTFIGGMWERNHQAEVNAIKASAVVEASKTTEQK
jgi:hypothetical protein